MSKTFRSSSSSAFSIRVLRELYDRRKGEGRILPMFFSATLVQAAAHGAMATCAGLLGQALCNGQSGAPLAFVDSPPVSFSPPFLCFLGLAAALAKTGAGALSIYGQKRASFRVGSVVRREVADAILRAGRAERSAARAHAAIAVRLREVERGVDEGVLAGTRAALHLVPLAGALVLLSSRLALASLAVLLPFALVLGWVRRRLRAVHAGASRFAEQLHAGVDELVRHLDLWRTYGASARVRGALDAAGDRAGRASARAEGARAALSGANEVLAALALLLAVTVVGQSGLAADRGSLVAFAAVFFLMYRPLRDLGDARTAVERGADALVALDGVRAGLGDDTAAHSALGKARTAADWRPARLEVRALSVVLGEGATPPTTLEAAPGEIVALVGPTGTGKTSLLRAMLGLERAVTGDVRYGELDLGGAGVGPAERPFAWVPQEPAIVAGTLTANVALGAPEDAAGEALARGALETVGAGALLARDGVELAAGGPELSGGERQWVAIARALATGLPVLLLDEPTSGLDAASQDRVLSALAAVRGKRTVILVTHRPEPLAIADRVVRIGNAAG